MPGERRPVLVIEDLPDHQGKISLALQRADYEVQTVPWVDEADIAQYKALNPENRVVIVDLVLQNASGEYADFAGWELIEKLLWPLDRTTQFILFSVDALAIERLRPSTEVGPVVVAVPKAITDGELADASVDELIRRVDDCHAMVPPLLPRPRYEDFQYLRHLDIYEAQVGTSPAHGAYREMVAESVRVLTGLTEHASTIANCGAPARDLTCFVFGSCGRYEMRVDSDVEMSIYFDATTDRERGERLSLAIKMWNRVARSINAPDVGYPFEGEQSLPNGFLDEAHAEMDLHNGFRPVLPVPVLLGADPTRVQNARNRYLQVLTEAKPVFNGVLLDRVSREILQGIAPNIQLGRELHNPRMKDVLEQYERDTTPHRFDDSKDAKNLVYRYLNVLAFRLGLVFLDDGAWKWRRARDPELVQLLEFLRAPGVIKCVRFANHCITEEIGLVVEPAINLVRAYFGTLEMFNTKYGGRISTGATMDHSAMRDEIKDLLRKFAATFDAIRESGLVPRNSAAAWLCESATILNRAEEI